MMFKYHSVQLSSRPIISKSYSAKKAMDSENLFCNEHYAISVNKPEEPRGTDNIEIK